MQFKVALLDSLNAYKIFLVSSDQNECNTYYQAQLDNNFAGPYTLSDDGSSMNYLMSQTYVANMTSAQQSGIVAVSVGCQQFCVLVSF